MLVFSRGKDQSVMIGDLVEVMVVEVRGGSVRLGFTAPREVAIHRREVWERIQYEKLGQPKEERDGE